MPRDGVHAVDSVRCDGSFAFNSMTFHPNHRSQNPSQEPRRPCRRLSGPHTPVGTEQPQECVEVLLPTTGPLEDEAQRTAATRPQTTRWSRAQIESTAARGRRRSRWLTVIFVSCPGGELRRGVRTGGDSFEPQRQSRVLPGVCGGPMAWMIGSGGRSSVVDAADFELWH